MQFFSSTVKNRIDAKGRVSIPAAFRKVLEQEATPVVVLIPEMDGSRSIEGMGHSRLAEFAGAIDRLDPLDPVTVAMKTTILGEARQLQVDETGRIVLGQDLREAARLHGEQVLFVGLGSTFQIWNPEDYEAQRAERRKLAMANFGRLRMGGPGPAQ